MKRASLTMAAICAALIRCGGDEGGSSNAAAGKTFTYGSPTAADATQRNAVQAPLAAAARGGASGAALGLASLGTTTTSLLGSPGVAYLRASKSVDAQEPSRTGQLNAGCISTSGSTIVYKNCQESFVSGDYRGTESLDGTISLSSDQKSANWDLTIKLDLTTGQFAEKAQAHESGSVTADVNHIRGHLLEELSGSVTFGSTVTVSGFDEEVIFDLTYQSNPFCVISGSYEAKRVWTRQPGQTAQPDKAVKLVWTGCNQATIAQSR